MTTADDLTFSSHNLAFFTPDDLAFSSHSLAIFCYDVSAVSVDYAGYAWRPLKDKVARAKTAADADRYPHLTMGSYRPFQGPLTLRWRARDGAQLESVIDLEGIFPERKVLHTEAPERIYRPMPLSGGEPTIIVELIDRTVNIHMLAHLQLVAQGGGHVREERVHRTLAYSTTLSETVASMPEDPDAGVQLVPTAPGQVDSFQLAYEQVRNFPTPSLYRPSDAHARMFFALFDETGYEPTPYKTNIGWLADLVSADAADSGHRGAHFNQGANRSFGDGMEAMYERFSLQAARWLKDDPQARISVVGVGFGLGAEQAAAFSRLVDARGVAAATARQIDTASGAPVVHYLAEPLYPAGTIAQALGLYDPVANAEAETHDRRPAPSVVSALQISAADERRAGFPLTRLFAPGLSADGRFLEVATAGDHYDIGGGAGPRASLGFSLMFEYLEWMLADRLIASPLESSAT